MVGLVDEVVVLVIVEVVAEVVDSVEVVASVEDEVVDVVDLIKVHLPWLSTTVVSCTQLKKILFVRSHTKMYLISMHQYSLKTKNRLEKLMKFLAT